MKCPYCMEEIANNSEKCSLCNSDIIKPCPFCLEKIQAAALKCMHCGSMLNGGTPQQQFQKQAPQPAIQPNVIQKATLPPGVAGWSWGACLLSWIWAIGNKVWIGLLALLPFVNIVMIFVLGFKGREWAWKSGQWESVDHFNRVQKKWSQWAVWLILIFPGVGGILAAIAIPQYSAYRTAASNSAALSDLRNTKTAMESYFADHQRYPETFEAAGSKPSENVYIKCSMMPDAYVCGAAHKQGNILYVTNNNETGEITKVSYKAGDPIELPYDPRPMGSAKADENLQTNETGGQPQPGREMVLRGKVVTKHDQDAGNFYVIKTGKKNVLIGSFGSFSDETVQCLRNALDEDDKEVELRGKEDKYGLLDLDATCKEVK